MLYYVIIVTDTQRHFEHAKDCSEIRRMHKQQRRQSTVGNPRAVILLCIIITIIIIFIIYTFLGPIYGSTFATIASCGVTIVFVITSVYYQLIFARYPERSRQTAIATSPRPPRRIQGSLPSTKFPFIQQRDRIVRDIYENKLKSPDATAIVLTGIVGSGKSLIAALLCSYAETQRLSNNILFAEKPIWLEVDEEVTLTDIAVTLCEALGKSPLDFTNMSFQSQALAVLELLRNVDKAQLIVIDQFDKLLDVQTGFVRPDRPGVGEWLDAILSEPCACRILLTSRSWPQGPRMYSSTDRNHYKIEGLDDIEANQLLLAQGGNEIAKSKSEDFNRAFALCDNNPWALTRLAFLLKLRNLNLSTFFNNSVHIRGWQEDLASHNRDKDLDIIYKRQLLPIQRDLVRALSLFRKPVSIDVIQVVINSTESEMGVQYILQKIKKLLRYNTPKLRIQSDCDMLLRQHLLRAFNDPPDSYQLHPMIAYYARDHFDENDEDNNKKALHLAHFEAAQYYLQKAKRCRREGNQQSNNALRQSYIVEAIWHLCQAGQRQKAYKLMERENLFSSLRGQNENTELLKLCQQMLLFDEQHLDALQRANVYNNMGDVCKVLGKNEEALDHYGKARDIFRSLGDHNKAAIILAFMIELCDVLGKTQQAQKYRDEA